MDTASNLTRKLSKGKSKASSLPRKPLDKGRTTSNRSAVGAPSQHNQSSRKGKKAWRKYVDIGDVEEGLEGMRVEERLTGNALQKTTDQDLFVVDVKGDDKVRHILPKKLSLRNMTSTKILSQRSAVPAVISRRTAAPSPEDSASKKRKLVLTKEEKDRLLRIAKRPKKGPFNSIMDPLEYGSGSSIVQQVSEAVKDSGKYDAWAPSNPDGEEVMKDGLEHVQKKKIKPPTTQRTQTRTMIEIPAVAEPHQGTSYNPPVDAHQELILKAASIEEKRVKDADKMAEVKKKMESAEESATAYDPSVPSGMTVQAIEDEDDLGEDQKSVLAARTQPKPKTKSQRNKAARLLAEKRALAERAHQKRLLASINHAKSLRKLGAQESSAQEAQQQAKKQALLEKLKKQGLAGTKLGKHKVPEGEVQVQLGEDLTETLRELKPEGNLFKDRFQSLQQRALIEPRVLVLPKKRKHRMVEYEKHAWKKFDRDHNS